MLKSLNYKFWQIFFLLLSFVAVNSYANLFPESPKPFKYVNDYTNTLTTEQVKNLEAKIVDFSHKTSSEIAIVIVPTTGDYDISSYAFELGDKWGIGKKDINNGILMLIAKNDRKIFIATGQGLEGALPDATIASIIRNEITPYFKNGDYYQGINNGLSTILAATVGEYKPAPKKSDDIDFFDIFFVLVVFYWLFIVIRDLSSGKAYHAKTRSRRSRGTHTGGFGGFGGGSGGGFGGGGFGGGGAGGGW